MVWLTTVQRLLSSPNLNVHFDVCGHRHVDRGSRRICRRVVDGAVERSDVTGLRDERYANRNDAVPMRQQTIHSDCHRDDFASARRVKFAVRLQILD